MKISAACFTVFNANSAMEYAAIRDAGIGCLWQAIAHKLIAARARVYWAEDCFGIKNRVFRAFLNQHNGISFATSVFLSFRQLSFDIFDETLHLSALGSAAVTSAYDDSWCPGYGCGYCQALPERLHAALRHCVGLWC